MGRLNASDAPQYQVPTAPNTSRDNTVASTKFVKSVGISRTVLASLPIVDEGLIFVDDMNGIWKWVSTAYHTGYRSLGCGGLVLGTTTSPLPGQVDAVGGVALKADYPSTYAFFQEQGLVIANASWVAGTFMVGDINATQFRWPDMRNMFIRFTGTDVDTASARALGTKQGDAIRNITGQVGAIYGIGVSESTGALGIGLFGDTPAQLGTTGGSPGGNYRITLNAAATVPTGNENRTINMALNPRICL